MLRSDYPAADASPGFLLWRLTNRWQAAQRAALKPYDLTHVQFVLLASLVTLVSDGPVTQRALATHASTDPMMTSQVVRVLEAKGLVERTAHPTDARAKALRATDAGIKLADAANAAVEAVDRRFFAPLGRDQARFTDLLRSVIGGSAARSA